jgi:hypothetical protein
MKRWLPPPFLLGALPRNGADINLPREMRDLCCFCTIPPVAKKDCIGPENQVLIDSGLEVGGWGGFTGVS